MMGLNVGTENKKQVAIAAVLGVVVLGLVIKTVVGSFSSGPAPAPSPARAPAPVSTTVAVTSSTTNSTTSSTSGSTQAAGQPATVVRTTTTTTHNAPKVPHLGANLDPTLHFEVMRQAESLDYTGRGRNIFSQSSAPLPEIPKVIGPVRPVPTTTDVANTPPPPPAIDLKFFGYSAEKSGNRKAFLLHGDDVFIAAEGDVVDHRYKVVKISAFSVQLEDLPYHDTQTLALVAN